MMRTIAAAVAALALFAMPASADKLGRDLAGARGGLTCYAEASGGKSITQTGLGGLEFSAAGLIGGVGAGCDWTSGVLVLGALARYDLADINGSVAATDAIWTAAARAGVKVNAHTLVFGLIGLSGTQLEYAGIGVKPHGLVWGGGAEFDIGVPNLSLGLEWTRTQWDRESILGTAIEPATDTIRASLKLKLDLFK